MNPEDYNWQDPKREGEVTSSEDLYKVLLSTAVYRLGGELSLLPEDIDEIQKTCIGFRMGLTKDGKILLRSVLR
jgi:hypothetical protein